MTSRTPAAPQNFISEPLLYSSISSPISVVLSGLYTQTVRQPPNMTCIDITSVIIMLTEVSKAGISSG
ncbi:unnamed protein product [Ixodes persulcatus]